MRRAGGNVDGIADMNDERLVAKLHQSFALCDVIKLFRHMMAMQAGTLIGWNPRFGKALLLIAVLRGMHQFANHRAIFGDVRLYR